MVVGIDAREAAPAIIAGKGRYVLEILRHLPAAAPDIQFNLYTRHQADIDAVPENITWREIGAGGLRWHLQTARLANRECDLYLATTSYLVPQLLKIPYVLVVYDLVSFKDAAAPQAKARRIERLTLGRAAKRACHILTISQSTADDLVRLFPATAGKVTVTPLAADSRFRPDYPADELTAVRAKYKLPKSFVLTTGTLEPRKNQARLIRAYGRLPKALRDDNPLVLVGKPGWHYHDVTAAIQAVGEDAVRHLDSVPDADLAKLYAAATVFCYPSLYEGFGLPVLEAMQSGLPVITSDRASLPELGGDAVRYVDPDQTGAIRDTLEILLGNAKLRRELRQAGLDRAKDFSWQRTAELTAEVIRANA